MRWLCLLAWTCGLGLALGCGSSKSSAPRAGPSGGSTADQPAAAELDADNQETGAEQESAAAPASGPGPTLASNDSAAFARAAGQMIDSPAQALRQFEALADANPDHVAVQTNVGLLRDRLGQTQGAEQALTQALELRPHFGAAVVGLATLYVRQGKLGKAEGLLNAAIEADAEAWDVRGHRAVLWVRQGKGPAAKAEAIATLKGQERSAVAMLALGMGFRRQEKYELATLALNQAIEIDKSLGAAYSELGLVLVAQDKKPQAVRAFEAAVAANPGIAALHNNVGALRNEVGAFKSAIDDLRRAVALRPDKASYYLNLGNAYRGEQRLQEAEKAYRNALSTGGGVPGALYNLGVLYLDNEIPDKDLIQRYEESIEFLNNYRTKVGPSPKLTKKIDEHIGTAQKAMQSEQKRRDRAKRRKERDAKKKAEASESPAAPEAADE